MMMFIFDQHQSMITKYIQGHPQCTKFQSLKLKSIVDSSVSGRKAGQALFKLNTSVAMIFLSLNSAVLRKIAICF